jgi:hypothetical protein
VMVAIQVVTLQLPRQLKSENKRPHTRFDILFVSSSSQLVALGAQLPNNPLTWPDTPFLLSQLSTHHAYSCQRSATYHLSSPFQTVPP